MTKTKAVIKGDKVKIKGAREGKYLANIEHKRRKNLIRDYKVNQFKSGLGLVFGVLILAILMINVIKFANGGKTITFSGLLNFLSTIDVNFKVPNLTTLTDYFTIDGKWAILDGLRIFINSLGSLLGVVAYLGANLVYCITFLSQLLIYVLG